MKEQVGLPTHPEGATAPVKKSYAHPMGWWQAFAGGIAYGSVITGMTYVVWRAITWSEPMHRFWPIFLGLWLMGFSCVLLMEYGERDKIKKGAIDLPGQLYGKREYKRSAEKPTRPEHLGSADASGEKR